MRGFAIIASSCLGMILAYIAGTGQGYQEGYTAGKQEGEAHAPVTPEVKTVEVPVKIPVAVPGPVQVVKVPEYIQVTKIERIEIPTIIKEYWIVKIRPDGDVQMEKKGDLP